MQLQASKLSLKFLSKSFFIIWFFQVHNPYHWRIDSWNEKTNKPLSLSFFFYMSSYKPDFFLRPFLWFLLFITQNLFWSKFQVHLLHITQYSIYPFDFVCYALHWFMLLSIIKDCCNFLIGVILFSVSATWLSWGNSHSLDYLLNFQKPRNFIIVLLLDLMKESQGSIVSTNDSP